MMLRLGFFALTLLCAMSASSAVVTIDYTAHITETAGDGMGYSVGDLLNGSFVIDTSKADGVVSSSATDTWLYGSATGGLIQSNYASNLLGVYFDYVQIFNNNPFLQDKLGLTKVLSEQGSIIDFMGVDFYFSGLDWIHDLSLNNINLMLNDSNSLAYSNGMFARFDIVNGWVMNDFASLSFDSVNIVSTSSVPEPTPLILFALGTIGLVVRRKMI